MDACTRTRTQPLVFQQGRTRYQGILPRAYRTYQSVGYGYGHRAKPTKQSVGYRHEFRTEITKVFGYGYGCRTELTKVSDTGMDYIPSLPRGGVGVVRMFHQAYQRGRQWYGCLYPYPTSGISTGSYPVPGYFPAKVPNLPKFWVRVWKSYQAYRSVGYG